MEYSYSFCFSHSLVRCPRVNPVRLSLVLLVPLTLSAVRRVHSCSTRPGVGKPMRLGDVRALSLVCVGCGLRAGAGASPTFVAARCRHYDGACGHRCKAPSTSTHTGMDQCHVP